MQPPSPRHLAEYRLPWRLLLVASGLTFAVLAALAASAAFVPEEPLVPSAGAPIPTDTTFGLEPSGPPSSQPPSSTGEEPSSTSAKPPAAGRVPLVARSSATALQATPGTPRPAPADAPQPLAAPATDEQPPPTPPSETPFSTLEATTTTTLEPTPTLESTTTTLDPAATTTTTAAVLTTAAEAEATTTTTTTTTAVALAVPGEQAAGVLLAPLLALLYLSRGLLARPAGRHARPGRYRLVQARSRRARRRPPARARTRP